MKAAHAWNSHFLVVDKPPGGPVQLKWELLGPETITDPIDLFPSSRANPLLQYWPCAFHLPGLTLVKICVKDALQVPRV